MNLEEGLKVKKYQCCANYLFKEHYIPINLNITLLTAQKNVC
jgi:hypothetical protein